MHDGAAAITYLLSLSVLLYLLAQVVRDTKSPRARIMGRIAAALLIMAAIAGIGWHVIGVSNESPANEVESPSAARR